MDLLLSQLSLPPGSRWLHLAGLLLVLALAVLQRRVGRGGAFWQICWCFPGTVLHEAAHLVVATLTGAQPKGFSILPRRESSTGAGRARWILGSVSIGKPGQLSALPSAMAPLGLFVVAYYLYRNWLSWFPDDLPHTLARYGTVYLFSYSAIPSGRDFKIALSKPLGVAFYFCVGYGIWVFWSR